VGVAFFPVDAHTAEGLAEAADRQLYEAKNSGRGCCKMSQMEEEPGTRRILGDVRGIVIN
jgi:predicted signal transduction protein with EAL and GGDEF domain